MLSDYYRDLLRSRFAGKKLVLATGVVAGSVGRMRLFAELGAAKPILLAMGIGTGELPTEEECEWHVLESGESENFVEGLRAYQRNLADLPAEVRAAVERYDPRREALGIRTFTLDLAEVAGRRIYGPKQASWLALEDKVVIDAFWDELGVPRAPSEIAALTGDEAWRAAQRLDRGAGTVWAGDAREGWHGGGEYVRWVRDAEGGERARAFLARSCDRVRVMPFLEGIPCSIHGVVFPDDVVVLRPVEMVVFRRPDAGEFVYAGCATHWDPDDADRDAMRALARRVGSGLRGKVGFRGTFTIDGVLTREGFQPTELNPRFGAGINTMAKAIPELPLELLDLAVCEGETWDFRPGELEPWWLEQADDTRAGGGWSMSRASVSETKKYGLVWDAAGLREAADGEAAMGNLELGPGITGAFVRFLPEPEAVAPGTSIAPLVRDAFAFCDARFGTDFGPLEVAERVR